MNKSQRSGEASGVRDYQNVLRVVRAVAEAGKRAIVDARGRITVIEPATGAVLQQGWRVDDVWAVYGGWKAQRE